MDSSIAKASDSSAAIGGSGQSEYGDFTNDIEPPATQTRTSTGEIRTDRDDSYRQTAIVFLEAMTVGVEMSISSARKLMSNLPRADLGRTISTLTEAKSWHGDNAQAVFVKTLLLRLYVACWHHDVYNDVKTEGTPPTIVR